jgi:hypothetical protein
MTKQQAEWFTRGLAAAVEECLMLREESAARAIATQIDPRFLDAARRRELAARFERNLDSDIANRLRAEA